MPHWDFRAEKYEWKNKNSLDGLHGRTEMMEKGVSESEDWPIEITQCKKLREKRLKKNEIISTYGKIF